jgi:hypothetical protein
MSKAYFHTRSNEVSMKRTKQDKLFWIQFDQANREYLTNASTFMVSFCISVIALLISVIAILIALDGITTYTVTVIIVFAVIMIYGSFWISKRAKKIMDGTKKLNEQIESELLEQYPEYKERIH